jgi:hypothetical protein
MYELSPSIINEEGSAVCSVLSLTEAVTTGDSPLLLLKASQLVGA